MYELKTGKLPPEHGWIEVLMASGGAVPILDRVAIDPWGRRYELQFSAGSFQVVSKGPDGILGTGDDVSSDSQRPSTCPQPFCGLW